MGWATGSVKVVGLEPGTDPNAVAVALLTGQPLPAGLIVRPVTADPRRRLLSRRQTIEEHFRTTGTPRGHGFTDTNLHSGTAYYRFDPAPAIRALVLDTVNPGGLSDGSLDRQQFNWLRAQLATAGRRLVVLFSHHTIATMTNPSLAPAETGPRVLGDEVRALLLAHPQVVLWVNGHTHVNKVTPHARPPGGRPGGFWELNTASHIDWPQQSRLVEMADNRDGTLSIFGTILDFAAPAADPRALGTPVRLAALSRELAANDWQERTGHSATVDGRRGGLRDRNVELIVPDPRLPG
jgi:metallophosphoesterase (TIGR03767 family)